jgi:hypothetical protein
VILVTALLWGAGINATPLSQPQITGMLPKHGLAASFPQGAGARQPRQPRPSDNWDFGPLMPLLLDKARARRRIV